MNITDEEFFTILNERYHYSLLDFLTRSKLLPERLLPCKKIKIGGLLFKILSEGRCNQKGYSA